jgi:outer membrane protein assembly factor BamA
MTTSDFLRTSCLAATLIFCGSTAHAGKFTDREKTKISLERPVGVPNDAELEAAGAVIGEVEIDIRDIFDAKDPRENAGIYRLANKLHITTKMSTVRAQLLFKSGDKYRGRLLEETERSLRGRRYFYDARVVPVRYAGGKVDVQVITKDVWTLSPGVSFGRKGGTNSTRVELEDTNFLGWGKEFALSRGKDVDRTSTRFTWQDPNIFGSRWTGDLNYIDSSDGRERSVVIQHPFYALDTRWSAIGSGGNFERTDTRYALGKQYDQFQHQQHQYELGGGLSSGLVNGWSRRWLAGWRYEKSEFGAAPASLIPAAILPQDRTVSYPYIAYEAVQDEFKKIGDQNQIGRTEDLYLGTAFRIEAGYSGKSIGATRNSVMLATNARSGFELSSTEQLYVAADAASRIESGSARNLIANAGASYYWRWRTDRVFYAGLIATTTKALDPETQLTIGGDSGLRGYPLRYEAGTSRALLTLEQRIYTDWYPWRLARVGGAIFFDAGRTWGRGVVGDSQPGLLKDIGVGLRSGLGNVLHVDLAFPLNGDSSIKKFQVNIETKRSF